MRFFILGSSGFIGTRLVKHLSQKGISLYAPASTEIDLKESSSVKKLSKLYRQDDHLIILAGIAPYRANDQQAFSDNLRMAENIRESLNEKVVHISYLSSDAVYGTQVCKVDEETQPAPDNYYGEMHLAREKIFEEFKDKVSLLRPTLVFGRDDPHNAYGPNRFIRSALERNEIKLFGRGEELRDYIEISDLCSFLIKSSEIKFVGKLNLVSGKSTRFIEIAKLIKKFRPSTEILFEKRKVKLRHRKYNNGRLKKFFGTVPNTICYHVTEFLRRNYEKN